MTQHEKVLHAVASLTPPAAFGDIVVEAWKRDARSFGLPGYQTEFPNSHRVCAALAHLVRDGMLTRPIPNHYALTENGRDHVYAVRRASEGAHREPGGG